MHKFIVSLVGSVLFAVSFSLGAFMLLGCNDPVSNNTKSEIAVTVKPGELTLAPQQTKKFEATVTGSANTQVTWKVQEPDGGTIDIQGNYRAPILTGDFHVIATSAADIARSDTALVHVTSGGSDTAKPYYSGTITLDRTGMTTTGVSIDEHETFQVNYLYGNSDKTVWTAENNTHFSVLGKINDIYLPMDPTYTITTSDWIAPISGSYFICMTIDTVDHKIRIAVGNFTYNCTELPSGKAITKDIYLTGTIVGDLPINIVHLNGSTTIDPEFLLGTKLDVSWNLTLH